MKTTDLSNSQLSKAITEKRWPEFAWENINSYVGRKQDPHSYAARMFPQDADNYIETFDCTIPNDILPIWGELVTQIRDRLLSQSTTTGLHSYASITNTVIEATKSTRKMAELIAWYYYGDELEDEK